MRRIFLVSAASIIIVLLFAVWWAPARGWSRSPLIKQQKSLGDGIVMHIDDLQVHRWPRGDALFVRCRYTGGDPNKLHAMSASLLASPNGPELDYGMYGQAAAAPAGEEGIPVFWTFSRAPENRSQITMRISLAGLPTPPGARFVDFTLRYLPAISPDGGDHYKP